MPIQKVMELSVLELDIWSAFLKKEQDEANRANRQMKMRQRRK